MYVLGCPLRFRVPYFGVHKTILHASSSGCLMHWPASRSRLCLMTSDILGIPLKELLNYWRLPTEEKDGCYTRLLRMATNTLWKEKLTNDLLYNFNIFCQCELFSFYVHVVSANGLYIVETYIVFVIVIIVYVICYCFLVDS